MVGASQSIGDVVDALTKEFSDITISKVRYLETQGLVTPDRAPSGYRRYTDVHIQQLRWVLQQQRDHFLPLRVIKEKLSTGDFSLDDQAQVAPAVARRSVPVSATEKPGVQLELSQEQFLERSGLPAEYLDDLERFGLVDPTKSRQGSVYGGDDLLVAQLAVRFLEHGVEPRHLRPWKVASDREAGLVDQRMASVSDNPGERKAAVADLIGLGDDLRSVLLRRALHDHL